jgi:uncharacterized protein YeaO (DUF488 family)
MVKVQRGQLKITKGVDVTVKSACPQAKPFAPTWGLVMGFIEDKITMAEYNTRYRAILPARVRLKDVQWLHDQAIDGVLTVQCYCRDQDFCHTHILVDWLVETYPQMFKK